MAMSDDSAFPVTRARAWTTLVLLGLLYLVSFVDRFILALLVDPLKRDLGVGNVELGLLFGTAFAFFYAVLGLPLARLADRRDRRRIVIAGAMLWSLCTIGSGFVASYGWLVALRIGLAIGEAALTPSAFSMIGDLFPARDRRRAASIYSAFGMFGAGGGYIAGGLVIAWLGARFADGAAGNFSLWQLVFISVGLPSLVLTLLFAIAAREPVRLAGDAAGSTLRDVIAYLGERKGLFASLILGAGLCQVPAYAMVAWMPYTLEHGFGLATADTGLIFGMLAIAATVGGTLLLPLATDHKAPRWRAAAPARVSALAAALAIVAISLAGGARHLPAFLALTGLGLMMLTGAANNILVAFQHLVPAQMRATFAALCLLSITLLGLGAGPPVFAAIAAAVAPGGGNGLAMAILTLASALPAVFLLTNASRLLRADDRAADE